MNLQSTWRLSAGYKDFSTGNMVAEDSILL